MDIQKTEPFDRSTGELGKRKPAKSASDRGRPEKLSSKLYEKELQKLQVELCYLQDWVRETGGRVVIVFEGRDTAGKGGLIRRLTERVSPRTFRVVALSAPTERERSMLYLQRYIQHFPAAGEVVIFDRSWYIRAGVKRVMGYASEQEVKAFLENVPGSNAGSSTRASSSSVATDEDIDFLNLVAGVAAASLVHARSHVAN